MIDRVFIIRKGPKRAIHLLELRAKTQKIQPLTLHYVDIPDILQAFHEKGYAISSEIQKSNNGDDYETFVCHWQKGK